MFLILLACTSADPKGEESAGADSPGETDLQDSAEESGRETDTGGETDTAGKEETGESSGGAEVVSSSVVQPEGRPTEVQLVAKLSGKAAARWICEGVDTAGVPNRHVAERTTGVDASATFYGLLADTDYNCALELEGVASASQSLRTGNFDALPEMAVTGAVPEGSGHWTLLNVGSECDVSVPQHVWVVDPQGRARWSWAVPAGATSDIAATWSGGSMVVGGGAGFAGRGEGFVALVGLDGVATYARASPQTGIDYHHEVHMLDDGTLLALTWQSNQADGEPFVGFGFEVLDPVSGFVGVDWNSQRSVDAGDLPGPFTGDAFHANAAQYVPDDPRGPSWWVSLPAVPAVARIDNATLEVTDLIGPQLGYDLYDVGGLLFPGDEGWFSGQHALAVEVRGDEIVLRVHDNRETPKLGTRLLDIAVMVETRTARVDYEWTFGDWYEPTGGDYDRLENGDPLFVRGHCSCCGTGSETVLTMVAQVDEDSGDMVWQLELTDETLYTYRASRVDACALFRDASACPAFEE